MKDANNILKEILSSGKLTDQQLKSLKILKEELLPYNTATEVSNLINNMNKYVETHGKSLS